MKLQFQSLLLVLVFSLTLPAEAIRSDYDDTMRPRRGDPNSMDNISLRLEGQHMTRTCPALIEQKVKNIPPHACNYYKITRQNRKIIRYDRWDSQCNRPCWEWSSKVCGVTGPEEKKFYSRLMLRYHGGKAKYVCAWEGCPYASFYGLGNDWERFTTPPVVSCDDQAGAELLNQCCPTCGCGSAPPPPNDPGGT